MKRLNATLDKIRLKTKLRVESEGPKTSHDLGQRAHHAETNNFLALSFNLSSKMRAFYLLLLLIVKAKGQNRTEAGLWVVYDFDDDNSTPHQQPPSCILAGMKAKIAVHGESHLPSLAYDLFPSSTTATNYTCGSIEPEQKLILNWQPDSEAVFYFRQNNDSNYLHHVELRMIVDDQYVIHANTKWDLNLMSVPLLFAFVCPKPLEIEMIAKVSKHEGGLLCESCNATLILTDTKIEVFRQKRYYNDLTHLKFRCDFGWPYVWVGHTILITTIVLGLIIFADFSIRYKKGSKE